MTPPTVPAGSRFNRCMPWPLGSARDRLPAGPCGGLRRAARMALLILLLPAVSAAQTVPPPPDPSPSLELGVLSERKDPIHITADQLEYRQEEERYIAEGHVEVVQGPLRLTADRMVLENSTGLLTATGNVILFEGEDRLQAERLQLNMNTSTGVVERGRIDTRKDNYHIEGDRMERLDGDLYEIENGSLTTCDHCEERPPAWRFRAKKLRLRLDHYATARGVAFYIKDIPLMYIPYLVFPVKTSRQSGLLFPQLAYSSKTEGFKLLQPFYWAIGPSHDATISLDYRSERGAGGVLEYRYALSRTAGGRFEGFYFFDREVNQEQIDLRFRHNQTVNERLDIKADINFINRKDVRRDLSSVTEERSQSSLESNVYVQHRTDQHTLSILARYAQNLLASDDFTLQRLPEVRYILAERPAGGLPILLGGEFNAVHFWRKDELEDPDPFKAQLRLLRVDLFPRIWWPIDFWGIATLTPHAGIRETYYSRGVEDREGFHREIPVAGVDLATTWTGRLGSRGLYLIEPLIQYEYADRLQDRPIPQFDRVDQIDDKNLLTYGITGRLLMGRYPYADPNAARLMLRMTQSHNLDRAGGGLSAVRLEGQIKAGPWISLDLDSFYDIREDRFLSINADAVWHWSSYLRVSGGQRYSRSGEQPRKGDVFNPVSLGETTVPPGKINFLTVGANVHLPWPWKEGNPPPGHGLYLASKGYYNVETSAFSELDYGVKYAAQCWELVVDYRDFPEKNQISFLVTLRGAATVDSRSAGGLFEERSFP